jgi:hypothetical protein
MRTFYEIYYWMLFLATFIAFPFLILYYETDETVKASTRIKNSFLKISIYLVGVIGLLVLTYFLLKKQNSFSVYIIAFYTFIGWILNFFAMGAGLCVLPYEYIWSWIIRPRPMKEAQFEVAKQIMLNDLLNLRKKAKALEEARPSIERKNVFKQWMLRTKIIALDCECIVVE